VIDNTPTEGASTSVGGESDPEEAESNPANEESTSGESDPEQSIPTVVPDNKTPYAWHAAAYRTLAELTNGTLRFAEETKVEGYKGAQTAILKISQHTYSMHNAAGNLLCAWVDGILYDPFSKVAMPIPEEEFCKDAFPYYPLSNAMLPLTEENFAGTSFTEEAETVSFTLHLTAEEYAELTGSPLGGKITEVIYTVVFDASTTLMQSVTAKAIFGIGEETSEYYSTITMELSALGTTAPATAPADADEYRVLDNNGTSTKPEQDSCDTAHNPEAGKDPEQNDKDEHEKEEGSKSLENNAPPQATPDEQIYQKELDVGKDLNGDGFVGAPLSTNPEDKNWSGYH